MSGAVILAFFLSGASFGVSVQSEHGPVGAKFENSSRGIDEMRNWLSALRIGPGSRHSCVAVAKGSSGNPFDTAAMEFAYDNTQTTFIWAPGKAETLADSKVALGDIAMAMLATCTAEHAR
ncbi:MAG: hypothetical protein LBQ32_08925 [Burkholderiaceae bacterium]|jgi:hypothetical protein|nr:hypothetical protein [Burkholderiaceae bacterium]